MSVRPISRGLFYKLQIFKDCLKDNKPNLISDKYLDLEFVHEIGNLDTIGSPMW